MSHLTASHLTLIQENLDLNFPKSENGNLSSEMWVLNPFTDDEIKHSDAPLELRTDYSQQDAFMTLAIPWISVLPCLIFPNTRS